MKKDIILAGVGGQGILSIAAVIGMAAVEAGLYLKQAEVHGMSQRGGAVQSHLRISDKPVSSDLIPEGDCDMILSVEPMESLRYLPFLHADGWLVSNSVPFVNIGNYPDIEEVKTAVRKQDHHILLDADSIAKEIGSVKVSNMVMLGAASRELGLSMKDMETAIRNLFGRKGEEIVQMNIRAVERGRKEAENFN